MKDGASQMLNKPYLRRKFDSQHDEESEAQLKCATQHFYQTFLSLWWKSSWKMSFFLISEILGLFVITLTADDNYSLHKRENLLLTIQMQFPKRLIFFQFFPAYLKSTSNFEHFQKEYDPHRVCISKLQTAKDVVS